MNGYVFHCTPCGFAHAGECEPKLPCPTCPASFCHGKLHHNWVKTGDRLVDLWNDFECTGCDDHIRRSAMDLALNVPTVRWAGPCPGPGRLT